GTILSVNADWWGTNITYIGYFMLFFGLFATLFWKGTNIWRLNSQLKNLHTKKLILMPCILMLGLANGQDSIPSDSSTQHGEMNPAHQFAAPGAFQEGKIINPEHARKFGQLLVQDYDGRIKPMNTHTLELMRKIHKKDSYKDINSDQWFLSMQINPDYWVDKPIFKVAAKGGDELLAETKANDDGYTTYMNLVDPLTGQYLLENQYAKAFSKRAADQTSYDKELINLTERFNIFNSIVFGYLTKVVPVQNDPAQTWNSWVYSTEESPVEIDKVAYGLISNYFNAIKSAMNSGDWSKADQALKEISDYQHKWGKNVMPSESEVQLEIFYNKANIFFWLMIIYSLLGGVLVILSFMEILSQKQKFANLIHKTTVFFLGILSITFLIHWAGLGIRWYLSGHAPWSNGYEAIIFISSIGVLAGLILYRNRNAFIPAAGAIVAMIMMGFAHGGSMLDPQITPLVPVLKSYWLMVHVGIITSSYGFFGLSAVIAIIALILLCFKPTTKIRRSVQEITIVSEMSSTIGVFALTIGTFLGGMWANESWGRYWSWDPKETWAFISVIIYAIVLHLRLVP